MKGLTHLRALTVVFFGLTVDSLRADFTDRYVLTPPAPGVYTNSGNYGGWAAATMFRPGRRTTMF